MLYYLAFYLADIIAQKPPLAKSIPRMEELQLSATITIYVRHPLNPVNSWACLTHRSTLARLAAFPKTWRSASVVLLAN